MNTNKLNDIHQRMDIMGILYNEVLMLENETLSNRLSNFKTENVQWVINAIHPYFQDIDYVLESEESNYLDN